MTKRIFHAFLLILTFSNALWQAVWATSRPQDHFHVIEVCIDCHSDGIDVSLILKQNDNSCLSCHTIPQLNAALNSKKSAVPIEKKPVRGSVEATLGMQYPLYSEQSRLGNAPNEMIFIPGGKFIRGTNHRLPDEGPQHELVVSSFWIDKFEVTNNQYRKFVMDTGRASPKHFVNRTFPQGKADHPVTYVTWIDAEEYCAWAGKRLPTDIEWEKAARGTDGREYPWGENFEISRANMPLRWEAIGEFGDTTPVGAFETGRSPYGVYDMTGNVWEWTDSWYQAYPGNKTPSESYGQRYKTLKGGSWFDCSFYKCGISAPVYNRAFFAPKTKNDSFGFRCAKNG